MSKMNLFVKEARKLLNLKEPITLVIGNESCDLDSAVCAVSLAYFYSKSSETPEFLLANGQRQFLPVMNILRTNLPLKTEVTYYMQRNGIDVDDLVCCNELPQDLLKVSKFVLVDHHVASSSIPKESVIQIYDHRPLDQQNAKIPAKCSVNIKEVGSCATLIANEIFSTEQSTEAYADVLGFLRGPIVLDTINFNPEADKARPLDIAVNTKIEARLSLDASKRQSLFNDLIKARSDVTALTAEQLLSKDLKIITNKDKSAVVAIPGFPILVEDYVQKENAWESLRRFGNEKGCDILVVMGMKELPTGGIRRDLGLVKLRETNLSNAISNALAIDNVDYLKLREKLKNSNPLQAEIFEQENVKASRKQILPIVQRILDNH